MNKDSRQKRGPVVPPSPYDFEETVRRVLKAPPMPKPAKKKRTRRSQNGTKS